MTLLLSQTYNKAILDCKHIQNHNELPEKEAVFITLLSMKEIKDIWHLSQYESKAIIPNLHVSLWGK